MAAASRRAPLARLTWPARLARPAPPAISRRAAPLARPARLARPAPLARPARLAGPAPLARPGRLAGPAPLARPARLAAARFAVPRLAAARLAALALIAALLTLPAPAGAQTGVSAAADALRESPVYVDPDAELAGQVDAAALRARIDGPTFIAVLPASALEGSAGRTLLALRDAVGEPGTYALAVGDEFRTIPAGPGETARAAHPDDLQAALLAFVDEPPNGGGAAGAIIAAGVLILVVLAGGALVLGRRRSRDGRSEVGEIDQTDDFVRLGDGIRALELDVTLGEAGPAAKADYDRAVEAYDRANALDRRGDEDAANRALDEGLAAIASARERIAGRR